MDDWKCDRCGSTERVQEHHILWKCMRDNQKIEDGERVGLCLECHKLIADYIIPVVWRFVSKEKKEECKDAIKSFTKKWVKTKS